MKKILIGLVLLSAFSAPVFSGNLEPSSPPGSTMKTLDEVEPRIPIAGSDIAVGQFIINQSGFYYLTGNKVCSGNGISINADDVTIDLCGFTISGSGISYGVYAYARNNVEIRNGTLRDFGHGIYANGSSKKFRVIEVQAVFNATNGIYLNSTENIVKNCTVNDNGTGSGVILDGHAPD